MKPTPAFCAIAIAASLLGCSAKDESNGILKKTFPESIILSAKNPTALARQDAEIVLEIAQLKAKALEFTGAAFVILADIKELASQAKDLDGDGNADQIVVVADFAPNETKALTVRYAESGELPREYPKRTQAELSHKFGGKFVNRKYEGGAFQNVQSLRVPPEHTDHSFYIRYEGPG